MLLSTPPLSKFTLFLHIQVHKKITNSAVCCTKLKLQCESEGSQVSATLWHHICLFRPMLSTSSVEMSSLQQILSTHREFKPVSNFVSSSWWLKSRWDWADINQEPLPEGLIPPTSVLFPLFPSSSYTHRFFTTQNLIMLFNQFSYHTPSQPHSFSPGEIADKGFIGVGPFKLC